MLIVPIPIGQDPLYKGHVGLVVYNSDTSLSIQSTGLDTHAHVHSYNSEPSLSRFLFPSELRFRSELCPASSRHLSSYASLFESLSELCFASRSFQVALHVFFKDVPSYKLCFPSHKLHSLNYI